MCARIGGGDGSRGFVQGGAHEVDSGVVGVGDSSELVIEAGGASRYDEQLSRFVGVWRSWKGRCTRLVWLE